MERFMHCVWKYDSGIEDFFFMLLVFCTLFVDMLSFFLFFGL